MSPTAHGQAAKASTGGELRRGLRRVGVLVEKKVPGMGRRSGAATLNAMQGAEAASGTGDGPG